MHDHDSLSLAAALIASGAKPPRVLETLAEVFAAYHDHDTNGGPAPHVVLSPQLAKFFRDLEAKHGMTAACGPATTATRTDGVRARPLAVRPPPLVRFQAP